MLKKIPQLFFLITCVSFPTLAQKLTPGYIVLEQRDTVEGFLTDVTDAELGMEIKFRKNRKDPDVVHSPDQLLGFGFNYGRKFKRQMFAINIPAAHDSTAIFAKQVITGKIDLFVWRRFRKNEGDMFLLNNLSRQRAHLTEPRPEVVTRENGSQRVRKDKRYQALLNYIKGDSSNSRIRYTEERLVKDVLSYNNHFLPDFPITYYKEKKKYSVDVMAGLPFNAASNETFFRGSLYLNKSYPEHSRRLSYFRGVSFSYWNDDRTFDRNVAANVRNYRHQFLSIIPIGINYHASSGTVSPYIYAGAGVVMIKYQYHTVENFVYRRDDDTDYFLTINAGIGVRVKTGPGFIHAELTPSVDGIFFNFGLSI